ncbi:MAG: lipopolysaccharide biosynthesis protein [Rhodoglobus sp.]
MSGSKATGLAGAASGGAKATMAGQLVRLVLQLVGMVVLARLLPPSDFGLVAMVMVIVGIAEVFRDFGLSLAAVQAQQLSQGQRSNLFWLNTGIGLVLTTVSFIAAWPIAALYGEPRLIDITHLASLVFLLNGAAAQFRVALSRELRFGRLAVIEAATAAGGLGVALVVAIAGGEYWAIVMQPVATALLALLTLIVFVPWSPGKYDRAAPMRSLLGFGGFLTLATAITYASRNVDSLLVGLRFGPAALGLYDRAYQLVAYALGNLEGVATRVAQPVLSRVQAEPERFRRYLLAGQSLLMQGTLLALGMAGAIASALIPLAFGERWAPMVPFFMAQLVAGAFASAARATYWCFLATGKTKSQLQYTLIVRPVQIAIIVIGLAFGPYGIVIAYATSNALLWLSGLAWISRWGTMPVRAMLGTASTSLLGYGAAATLGAVATNLLLPQGPFLAGSAGAVGFIACLGVLIALWPAFRRQVLTLRALRKGPRGQTDLEGN